MSASISRSSLVTVGTPPRLVMPSLTIIPPSLRPSLVLAHVGKTIVGPHSALPSHSSANPWASQSRVSPTSIHPMYCLRRQLRCPPCPPSTCVIAGPSLLDCQHHIPCTLILLPDRLQRAATAYNDLGWRGIFDPHLRNQLPRGLDATVLLWLAWLACLRPLIPPNLVPDVIPAGLPPHLR
jgi:hypothetical protein